MARPKDSTSLRMAPLKDGTPQGDILKDSTPKEGTPLRMVPPKDGIPQGQYPLRMAPPPRMALLSRMALPYMRLARRAVRILLECFLVI